MNQQDQNPKIINQDDLNQAGLEFESEYCDQPEDETELEILQKKYDELADRNLRLVAEYDNFRKRTSREKDELFAFATAATIEKFLPVADNFDRACCFEQGTEEFKTGFNQIVAMFGSLITSLGVTPIGAVGEKFDPTIHNAVSHIEDPSLGELVISQVLQKGYKLGDKVIRCAMVQTAN